MTPSNEQSLADVLASIGRNIQDIVRSEARMADTDVSAASIIQVAGGKGKSALDWRHQFEKNPLAMMGVAFGGGVLLASLTSGRARQSRISNPGVGDGKHPALDTWDRIKAALIAVAARQVSELAGKFVRAQKAIPPVAP